MEKLDRLKRWFGSEGRAVVAFSGGVDSAVLAVVARDVLGKDMVAVTGDSHSLPSRDRKFAEEFCKKYGISHRFIRTGEFDVEGYRSNSADRCYYCKAELYKTLTNFAVKEDFTCVADGTNYSDLSGHRPGLKAMREIERVRMPYLELKISKGDIREIAEILGLDAASKPQSACLASRIPWGKKIEPKDLMLVDTAENALRDMGFSLVRVRHHGNLARIQCDSREIRSAVEKRREINDALRKLGYKHVTFDMACYGE